MTWPWRRLGHTYIRYLCIVIVDIFDKWYDNWSNDLEAMLQKLIFNLTLTLNEYRMWHIALSW